MRTVEIPREEWGRRLEEFSAIHEKWLVSLDVLGPDIGAQREINSVPLLGISADDDNGGGTIFVSAGRSIGDHITRTIHRATRVFIERTDEGADAALQVESADGTSTILRFRAAALPETVDGMPR